MISSLRTFVNIYVRGRHLCPSWRQIYDLHKLSKEEIVYIWSVLCLSYSSVFSCFSLSLSVRACVCVCVCVCARARASERECACVCVCVVKLLAGEVSFNQDIALSTLLVTRLVGSEMCIRDRLACRLAGTECKNRQLPKILILV